MIPLFATYSAYSAHPTTDPTAGLTDPTYLASYGIVSLMWPPLYGNSTDHTIFRNVFRGIHNPHVLLHHLCAAHQCGIRFDVSDNHARCRPHCSLIFLCGRRECFSITQLSSGECASSSLHFCLNEHEIHAKIKKAAGALLFVTCILGWYLLAGLLLPSVDFPLLVPLGDLSHVVPGLSDIRARRERGGKRSAIKKSQQETDSVV